MTISDKKKVSLKNIKKYTIKKMAEAWSDEDTRDSIDSVLPMSLIHNSLVGHEHVNKMIGIANVMQCSIVMWKLNDSSQNII